MNIGQPMLAAGLKPGEPPVAWRDRMFPGWVVPSPLPTNPDRKVHL